MTWSIALDLTHRARFPFRSVHRSARWVPSRRRLFPSIYCLRPRILCRRHCNFVRMSSGVYVPHDLLIRSHVIVVC